MHLIDLKHFRTPFPFTSLSYRVDEVRISNIVRYSSSFTPSTTPFEVDSNTVALWHLDESVGQTVSDASENSWDGVLGSSTATESSDPTWSTDSPITGITNEPPVAVDDAYDTDEDTVLNVSAPGVLGNDTDADEDTLTAELVGDVSHGSLILNSDGSFTYTPASGYTGSDSFTYQAYDGEEYSNTASVSITINPISTATFGLDSGDVTWNDPPNYLSALRFQNTAGTGTLTKLEILVYDYSPNGMVRLGVYADDSGVPGSLLLDAGEVTVTNGWVSIDGLSLSVTRDTYYWLAYDLNSENNIRYKTGGAPNSSRWIEWSYGSFPSQYPGGSDTDNTQTVMRATVTIE